MIFLVFSQNPFKNVSFPCVLAMPDLAFLEKILEGFLRKSSRPRAGFRDGENFRRFSSLAPQESLEVLNFTCFHMCFRFRFSLGELEIFICMCFTLALKGIAYPPFPL